jgi:O-acetyl-ADP-ribose deacetylase (regulator of RNase III)
MPIKFISLNKSFIEKIKKYNYESYNINIQDYIPNKNKITFYVSPGNSLCFMDGGIDLALSTILFPKCDLVLKQIVSTLGFKTKLDRFYLPIGSSIILNSNYDNIKLICAPTMLLPQNINGTNNVYFAIMSILSNILINNNLQINDVDILLTSFGCGYGKLSEDESIRQILKAINDYSTYTPKFFNKNIAICEPNLNEQPKYYQNTEWLDIDYNQIII